ncbi:tRNA (guanosine(46)-N7)-methyltransferase TrmB [Cytophagaceae bacterium ABcell3]|nr:tRNA (guanosine(46)-N7)-methyltransferase TrmB [Cytophagaceae bacterium ABcell3]
MPRRKLARFEHNAKAANVIEPGKEIYNTIKGNWSKFFKNDNPIVLELGCGRGEYTTGLANRFPEKNFIGVDVKGCRIWKGSTVAIENNMHNVAFLRAQIRLIRDYFEKNEVEEIWVTFPDPKPRDRDEKNRLPGPEFLGIYKDILKEGGRVHLKTDCVPLFDFALEKLQLAGRGNTMFPFYIKSLEFTHDLYSSELLKEQHGIQTTYEKKFLGEGLKINYLRFQLFSNPDYVKKVEEPEVSALTSDD